MPITPSYPAVVPLGGHVDEGTFRTWMAAVEAKLNGYPDTAPRTLFNLCDDAGRFAGSPEAQAVTAGAYVAPTQWQPYNGGTFAQGDKFLHNNTTYGGAAGALGADADGLVTKLKPSASVRRYGIEFYVVNGTAGSGTAGSPVVVASTNHYLAQTIIGSPIPAKATLNYYVKAVTGALAIMVFSNHRVYVDNVRILAPVQLLPADGWKQITVVMDLNPNAHLGYASALQSLYAAVGSTYRFALPTLYPGHYDVESSGLIGCVPSLRAFR